MTEIQFMEGVKYRPAPRDHTHPELHDRVLTAEDLIAGQESRLAAVEETVDNIKLANNSKGEGAPTGTAPVGWYYEDVTTGDLYRMEA